MVRKSKKQKRKTRQSTSTEKASVAAQPDGTKNTSAPNEENEPAPPREPADSSKPTGFASKRDPYRTVRRGIGLIYYALWCLVAEAALAILTPVGIFTGGLKVMLAIALLARFITLAATVMGFVGKLMCLAAPKETGGKRLVYVAVVLEIVVATIALSGFVIEVSDGVDSLSSLLSLTALVVFLFFLRRMALFLKRPQLAERAAMVLKIGVSMMVMLVMTTVGFSLFPPTSLVQFLLVITIFMVIVSGLVGFVLYLMLLGGLRSALSERLSA